MKLSSTNWKFITGGLMGFSSILATELVRKGWKLVKKEEPPLNHASSSVKFSEALLLTTSIAVIGGLIKLTASRFIADKWQSTGGELPDKKPV